MKFALIPSNILSDRIFKKQSRPFGVNIKSSKHIQKKSVPTKKKKVNFTHRGRNGKKTSLWNKDTTLKSLQTPRTPLDDLEEEFKRLQEKKGLSKQDKWRIYQDFLKKYLRWSHVISDKTVSSPLQSESSLSFPLTSSYSEDESAPRQSLIIDSLTNRAINSISKPYKDKASRLMRFIFNQDLDPNELRFTQNGLMVYNRKAIQKSNFIDLVTYAIQGMKTKEPPVGWKQFAKILQNLNTPQILLKPGILTSSHKISQTKAVETSKRVEKNQNDGVSSPASGIPVLRNWKIYNTTVEN